jgi:hypothetical protein
MWPKRVAKRWCLLRDLLERVPLLLRAGLPPRRGHQPKISHAISSHSPTASAAALRPGRARLCIEVTRLLTLQAQLSRVKLSETPSQTSHDRNLSEGSIVGPYTPNSLLRSQPEIDFQQAAIPSLGAAAFLLLAVIFSLQSHGSRSEHCASHRGASISAPTAARAAVYFGRGSSVFRMRYAIRVVIDWPGTIIEVNV